MKLGDIGGFEQLNRHQILKRVKADRLSPSEAEDLARDQGIGPLASLLGGGLDPMNLSDWTLAMAIAWIAGRSPDAVKDACNDYRAKCWEWQFRRQSNETSMDRRTQKELESDEDQIPTSFRGSQKPQSGEVDRKYAVITEDDIIFDEIEDIDTEEGGYWALERIPFVSIESFGMNQRISSIKLFDDVIRKAENDLWNELRTGNIQAFAIKLEPGETTEIPSHEWRYLESDGIDDEGHEFFNFKVADERYARVVVERKSIIKIWPASESLKSVRQRPRIEQVKKILAELEQEGVPIKDSGVAFARGRIERFIESNPHEVYGVAFPSDGSLRQALKEYKEERKEKE